MQQFFAEPSWIREGRIFLEGSDVNHIKNVLRMRPGEDVRISDGNGRVYLCCISAYEEKTAVLDILKELDIPREMLPQVKPSSCIYSTADSSFFGGPIPIGGHGTSFKNHTFSGPAQGR